ncbi:hypothetical protein MRX96_020750 [Rhipicephalus microplus]
MLNICAGFQAQGTWRDGVVNELRRQPDDARREAVELRLQVALGGAPAAGRPFADVVTGLRDDVAVFPASAGVPRLCGVRVSLTGLMNATCVGASSRRSSISSGMSEPGGGPGQPGGSESVGGAPVPSRRLASTSAKERPGGVTRGCLLCTHKHLHELQRIEVSPHDSWEHAMTLARDVSLKSLTVVLADDQVKSANWRSLLGEAQPITFFTDTSLVPEEHSSHGLVLSSKISSLSKALDGLRKQNLTGYGVHWQLVVSSPASKKIFLAGFDGEQLALQLPLPSSLHNTCTAPREKETQATLYSLRSLGNGSTCWAPVVDWTSQLFEAYPSSLSDRTLRVVSLGLYPVRKKPEAEDDWRWSGFVFDVLNCLADSLHFRYESRDPEHHYYFAQLPSGAYVGVIGDVARKVADVALGDLSRTMARDALVDFTSFILDDTVTFVYYRGRTEPGLWTVLKPFPASVWALTLSAIVLMIVLLFTCNVARGALKTLDGTSTCSRRAFAVAKCVMRSYITQGKIIEEGPRPLLACWYVVLLVLTTVYCGRLTAFYVATLEEPVTSLAQLVARRPHAVILVKNGSLPYEVLRQKTYESLWRQRVVRVVSARTPVDDLLRMVAQHHAAGWMAEAAFGGARIREARMNGLSVASTSMAVSRWCIGLRQGSPLVPLFNRK